MDDESRHLLRQLVDAQKEQTELLRKHVLPLWTRIRFSLLALFMLTTLMAMGVGFTVLAVRSTKPSTATRPPAITTFAAPNGTLQITTAPMPADLTRPISRGNGLQLDGSVYRTR
jgi:hypothetical protein